MKTIVITGSTRGIGFSLAKIFLAAGHNVVINGRSETAVSNALNSLNSEKIIGHAGDITLPATIADIYNSAEKKFKNIDIWINNAGLTNDLINTWEIPDSEIKKIFDTNIFATAVATNFVFKKMKEQGHGKIFNLEGLGSDGRIINKMAIYGTTKCAVSYFTRAFARECEGTPVQAGTISPGMVMTDMLRNSLKNGSENEISESKKIFNMLAEEPGVVAKYLVKKILESRKNYDRINFMSPWRIFVRLLKNKIEKRDFFKE